MKNFEYDADAVIEVNELKIEGRQVSFGEDDVQVLALESPEEVDRVADRAFALQEIVANRISEVHGLMNGIDVDEFGSTYQQSKFEAEFGSLTVRLIRLREICQVVGSVSILDWLKDTSSELVASN